MAFATFMAGGAGRVLVGDWFLLQAGKQETSSRTATARTSHSPAD